MSYFYYVDISSEWISFILLSKLLVMCLRWVGYYSDESLILSVDLSREAVELCRAARPDVIIYQVKSRVPD